MERVKYGVKTTRNELSVSQRNFEHSKIKNISFVFVLIKNLKMKERKTNTFLKVEKKTFFEIQSDF